jgi:hypothetical protein
MTHDIKSSQDLLGYLAERMDGGAKNWFGYPEQRITGVALAHDIAKNHADKFTPEQIVDYVVRLNNAIYDCMIRNK